MKFRFGINTRLFILFIVVIVTLTLFTGIMFYVNSYKIFEERVIKDLSQLSLQMGYNIDAIISGIDQATMQLYTDRNIMQALSKDDSASSKPFESVKIINAQLFNISLNNILSSYYITFFLDNSISFSGGIPSSNLLNDGVYSSFQVADEEWYNGTIKNDGTLYLSSMFNKHKVDYICVSRLIKNSVPSIEIDKAGSLDDRVGVISVCFNIDHIKDIINKDMLTPNSQIVLLTEDGIRLYSTEGEKTGLHISEDSFISYIINNSRTGVSKQTFDNEGYVINNLVLKANNQLLTITPVRDIAQTVSVIKNIVLTACIISFFVGAFLTLVISNRITLPIRKLTSAMSEVKDQGSLNISLKTSSKDEVGTLYEKFNQMMRRISELVQEVYESSNEKRKAEIKALEAQINPHFLYNTLDTVNWLALQTGSDDIAVTITSLSEILQYSICSEEFVTLEEEIRQLSNYVNIQKISCGDSFDLAYNICEELLKAKIPKLILQPLLENAIQHGVSKIKERGNMSISVFSEFDDAITIVVENNGIYVDVNRLNQILQEENYVQDHGGYGIRNVNQRVKLHFGEKYGLHYVGGTSGGVKAIIDIPIL